MSDKYHFQEVIISEGQSYKYLVYQEDRRIRFNYFLTLLKDDERFRNFYIDLLSEVPLRVFQWETPPVSKGNSDKLFEFVVSKNSHIDLPPDPGPFRSYFDESEGPVAVFYNLGKDAKLIAPEPYKQLNYSHIGVFTEHAPKKQQHVLWQRVGRETLASLSDKPLWLNTAGGGVAWLHVRLDSRPKYYRHRPYISGD